MPFFILILIRHRIACTNECDCQPEREPTKEIYYEKKNRIKNCSFLLLPRSSRLLSFLIRNGENSHSNLKRDSRPMHTNDSRFKFLCFIQSFVALLTLLWCFFRVRSVAFGMQNRRKISFRHLTSVFVALLFHCHSFCLLCIAPRNKRLYDSCT